MSNAAAANSLYTIILHGTAIGTIEAGETDTEEQARSFARIGIEAGASAASICGPRGWVVFRAAAI